MRLTPEQVAEEKKYLSELKERVWFGEHGLTSAEQDLFDTIEALQQENEQLQAQVARMREALESIKRLDKTEYTYYGARARNKNGELPPDGERWKTPMEIAMGVLSTDIDQDYHNPADVEALRKAKEEIQKSLKNYELVGEHEYDISEHLQIALAAIDKVIGGKEDV